jgi:hypothetical protein
MLGGLEAVVLRGELPREGSRVATGLSPADRGRAADGSSVATCTLGFNAGWSRIRGFLLNSHCTSSFWVNDGTSFRQNASPSYVGYETRDPGTHSCGIFGSSTAAGVTPGWGRTPLRSARPTATSPHSFWPTGDGNSVSLTINNSNPSMRSRASTPSRSAAKGFDKMGRTTGWTFGFVGKTCVDVNKGGWRRARCQDYIRKMHGDSGSPIFRSHGNVVTLAGIL